MRALLDFPWPIQETLSHDPEPLLVLELFVEVCKTRRLSCVPFIDAIEEGQFLEAIEELRGRGRFSGVLRFLSTARRVEDVHCQATPDRGPRDLRPSWKAALFDEMLLADWRSPQIVIPAKRRVAWPDGSTISVIANACSLHAPFPTAERVLAVLEEYESHDYACSDNDPWDVRHVHRGTGRSGKTECRLPKPPECQVPALALAANLEKARRNGPRRGRKYYYLPPLGWSAESFDQSDWRNGEAFEFGTFVLRNERGREVRRKGYRDAEGRVWVWDTSKRHESHWDVQFDGGGHVRVSTAGDYDPSEYDDQAR